MAEEDRLRLLQIAYFNMEVLSGSFYSNRTQEHRKSQMKAGPKTLANEILCSQLQMLADVLVAFWFVGWGARFLYIPKDFPN